MTTRAPQPTRVTGLDRCIVSILGTAGSALSYDALRQTATAIHARSALTYAFPLVVDGFIAYGVRALLVLRTAPFPARLYAWLLFGTATATSIWANALHAVRLNQQRASTGLHLGNATVGILSTVAPLALAGAVHLYILIARQAPRRSEPGHSGGSGQLTPSEPNAGGQAPEQAAWGIRPVNPSPDVPTGDGEPVTDAPFAEERPSSPLEKGKPPVDRDRDFVRQVAHIDHAPQPGELGLYPAYWDSPEVSFSESAADGLSGTDPLLVIARRAVEDSGKVTRAVVINAIREQGLPLSSTRLSDLMRQLRTDADPAAPTSAT